MYALSRARYLTHHYQDLQGYRLLPFAAAFLAVAVNAIWLQATQASVTDGSLVSVWRTTIGLPVTCLSLALLASHLIGGAYALRYGRVTPAHGVPLSFSKSAYGLAAVLGLVGDLSFGQPVLGPQLVWLWLVVGQARHYRGLRHVPASTVYLLTSVVLLLGRRGYSDLQAFDFVPLVAWSLVAVAVTLLAALFNHRLLLRLRAAPATGEAV